VGPVPGHALAEAAVEEDLVGGREDGLECVVVEWVIVLFCCVACEGLRSMAMMMMVAAAWARVDNATENAFVFGVRVAPPEGGQVVADSLGGFVVFKQLG
jgi:hypothetical protein